MVETYKVSETLTFILTDTKILVKTPLQENLVIYASGNYKTQWKKLRLKIQKNEIKSISQLLDYNNTRIGGISQMQGLIMVNTKIERHIC